MRDHARIDRISDAENRAGLVAQLLGHLLSRPVDILAFDFDIEMLAQTIEDVVEQWARNPDAGTISEIVHRSVFFDHGLRR